MIAPGVSATFGPAGSLEVAQPGFGGWSGNYLANRSTGNPASVSSVLLTGLPPHSRISIDGILGFLESWDSNDGAPWATPDLLQISVDGTPVLAGLTINTASGTVTNYGGGTPLFTNVQATATSSSQTPWWPWAARRRLP